MVINYYKKPYSDEDPYQYIKHLDKRWIVLNNGKSISREFSFKNFDQSIDFVNEVAKLAKKSDHHPKVEIDYDKVILELTTHKIGHVTEKDSKLAEEVEEILKGF